MKHFTRGDDVDSVAEMTRIAERLQFCGEVGTFRERRRERFRGLHRIRRSFVKGEEIVLCQRGGDCIGSLREGFDGLPLGIRQRRHFLSGHRRHLLRCRVRAIHFRLSVHE